MASFFVFNDGFALSLMGLENLQQLFAHATMGGANLLGVKILLASSCHKHALGGQHAEGVIEPGRR